MEHKKEKLEVENSLDYFNFCQVENELKILDELNNNFVRSFRVSISNHLNSITNVNSKTYNDVFGVWAGDLKEAECFFIVHAKGLNSPVLIHFDKEFSYGAIELLTGGVGKDISSYSMKDYTNLEASLLQEIALKLIKDLNENWRPIHDISLQLDRIQVSSKLIAIVPSDSKVKKCQFDVEFQNYKGCISIIYPYTTLFPLRNKLYAC